MNSSLYYQISDRTKLTRTDQVCVYPRRPYRRQTRHNPYMLALPVEQNPINNDINGNNEFINQSEEKPNEIFSNEIKTETVLNFSEDQVVIPNDDLQSNKINKRRIIMNLNCQNCKQKFKTKNQFNSHLMKCSHEFEQK